MIFHDQVCVVKCACVYFPTRCPPLMARPISFATLPCAPRPFPRVIACLSEMNDRQVKTVTWNWTHKVIKKFRDRFGWTPLTAKRDVFYGGSLQFTSQKESIRRLPLENIKISVVLPKYPLCSQNHYFCTTNFWCLFPVEQPMKKCFSRSRYSPFDLGEVVVARCRPSKTIQDAFYYRFSFAVLLSFLPEIFVFQLSSRKERYQKASKLPRFHEIWTGGPNYREIPFQSFRFSEVNYDT